MNILDAMLITLNIIAMIAVLVARSELKVALRELDKASSAISLARSDISKALREINSFSFSSDES